MRAYLVFKGGGVKGAALAGCLDAVREAGIVPAGYGGTSAGALVATLAAVGFTGRQMQMMMNVGSALHPLSLLSDGGLALNDARREIAVAKSLALTGGPGLLNLWRAGGWLKRNAKLIEALRQSGGLYTSDKMRAAVLGCLIDRLPGHTPPDDVRFSDLAQRGLAPLKIVASDLTRKKAAVFSADHAEYGDSVLDAVCASASYPLMFRPVSMASSLLSDGGLASNLPAFLFAEEHRRTRHPVLAFDLVDEAPKVGPGIADLLPGLLETALGASDDLIADTTSAHRIAVRIPRNVDTLKFDLTSDDVEALYNADYAATANWLNRFDRLNAAKSAAGETQKQLQAVYAEPRLISVVLRSVVQELERVVPPGDHIRASVMLSTGRTPPSRIVAYDYNFRPTDGDLDLELHEDQGCTGVTAAQRKICIFDLHAQGFWKPLTAAQQGKIPVDRHTMVCIPVFNVPVTAPNPTAEIIGILSMDCKARFDRERWKNLDPNSLITWANVLTCLLLGDHGR